MSELTSRSSSADIEAELEALKKFDEDVAEDTGVWIFGYGSLCWLHDFHFENSCIGFIRGFSRKFWQGNTAHRGTKEKPGRVATLVEEKNGVVWGTAFQISKNESFTYLNHRECELGGYLTIISEFYPQKTNGEDKRKKSFPVFLYVATPANNLWLGDSPLPEIANQIVECKGNSGHNVEYLLKLADFIRENIPEAVDEHLFKLEKLVRSLIEKRNLCMKTLMGDDKNVKRKDETVEPEADRDAGRNQTETLQYTSTVPSKQLRCVNI